MDSSPGLSDNRTGKVLGPLRTVDLSPGKTSSGEAAKERRGWVLHVPGAPMPDTLDIYLLLPPAQWMSVESSPLSTGGW